ncbi:MAG: DUF3347 domain-containing protein [Balneolales bacterium]
MKRHIHFPLFVLLFVLISCSSGDHSYDATEQGSTESHSAAFETPDEFKKSLDITLTRYFDLKDALIEEDGQKAARLAQAFQESLEQVKEDDLSDEAHSIWRSNREIMNEESYRIAGVTEIEEQRKSFNSLSMALIHSLEAFGPLEKAVHRQSCPMVGDGSADWLSSSEEIMNPYLSSNMLNCGTVVRTY